jgi:hypothetical protein
MTMSAEAAIAYILGRQHPMTLRLPCANLAEQHSADAVTEALQRLQGLGLIATDEDGLLRLDHAKAAETSRKAARQERLAHESPVKESAFR